MTPPGVSDLIERNVLAPEPATKWTACGMAESGHRPLQRRNNESTECGRKHGTSNVEQKTRCKQRLRHCLGGESGIGSPLIQPLQTVAESQPGRFPFEVSSIIAGQVSPHPVPEQDTFCQGCQASLRTGQSRGISASFDFLVQRSRVASLYLASSAK